MNPNENINEGTDEVTDEVVDEVLEENPFKEMTRAFAKKDTGPSGTYLKDLSGTERSTLEAFVKWMEDTNFSTAASRASYKSYVAACMVAFKNGKSREDLTSSQKSGAKKFAEFLETLD